MRSAVRKAAIAAFAAVVGTAGFTSASHAHPHVWIGASVQFNMKDGKVVSVTQRWEFDPMFGAMLANTFDVDKNKKLSKAEIGVIRQRAFKELRNYSYFTLLRIDGKAHKITEVAAFSAKFVDDKVVYIFTVKLPKAIDPRRVKADFRFIDKTYYVDVGIKSEKHIRLSGKGSGACGFKVVKDTENPIYFGMVVPNMVVLSCAGS